MSNPKHTRATFLAAGEQCSVTMTRCDSDYAKKIAQALQEAEVKVCMVFV